MRAPWIKQPTWLADMPAEAPRARPKPGKPATRGAHKRERFASGETGAVWHPDGPVVYDAATPLSALLQAEVPAGEDRTALLADVLGYVFADGPHPAHVMRRVFILAAAVDPDLLNALDVYERRWLRASDSVAQLKRVAIVIRGTRIAARPPVAHSAVIVSTLAAAAARMASPATAARVELSELVDLRDGEELADYEQRQLRLRALLRFIFYFGPRPEGVTRRVFCLAKWRPMTAALLLDMSLANLGRMFGETRAAWSWRVKRVVNYFLTSQHVRGGKAGFQKSEEACAVYAQVQRRNRNRTGGAARVA